MSLLDFFTDPLLRAPFIASILIAFVTSLIGVTLFVQRRSLLAETLSHASYPGVIAAAILSLLYDFSKGMMILSIVIGGMATSFLGTAYIEWMTKRLGVHRDAAFTFVLATFFSVGILLSSYIQYSHPLFFQTIRQYLYGQAATLTDSDIVIYALFSLIVLVILILFYKESTLLFFDSVLARLTLKYSPLLSFLVMSITVASVVISMRSVGVILISGLLVAPALAARQYTHRLPLLFGLAGCFGASSAFLGNLLSFYLSQKYNISLSTGPMIVMAAQGFAFGSLLFAPERGLAMRYVRIYRFQWKCMQENLMKMLWRHEGKIENFASLHQFLGGNRTFLYLVLLLCRSKGWIIGYQLTEVGKKLGREIVRLHRLWELYLVEDLGFQKEHVHKSAEEMEHILTPQLAMKLTAHLSDPLFDPHNQPIPLSGEATTYG